MAMPSPNPHPRDRVFLSYAHKDAEWLDRLRNRLAPDIRNHRLDYFDDREIRPGEDWRPRIAAALARAGTAVLLVSPDFFASEFIMREELPPILEAAAAGQLVVLWVPLHGEFNTAEAAALTRFQAVGDPQHPLAGLPEEGRMRVLADLCREIDRLLGRERDLEALDQGLREHGAAAVTQPHTISGLGGIGKTRLAVEYAWRGRDRFRALLFARAGTPAELRAGLASLARGDGLLDLREQSGTEEEQYDAVVRWLQHNRGWLLILDNVDTPEGVKAVEDLVARIPGGHVLITSRLTDWEGVAQRRLDVLDAEGARDLLHRGSGVADTAADELAKRLGYLPLALEQAAAYVRKQPPGFGFAGYLRLYEANEHRMLATRGAESSAYPASVYLTWRTTVDQLPEGARRLLRLHAWIAPTAFPVDLYIKGAEMIAPGATEMDVRDWIAALVDYSMAERQLEDAISVHALVQAVERHRSAEESTITAASYRDGMRRPVSRRDALSSRWKRTRSAKGDRHEKR